MKVTINGKVEVIEKDGVTISELLKIKQVKMPEMVTVEHNGEIIDRENYAKVFIKDGDTIEFLYYMGGGTV
jgi:sulfur carrier protein